MINTGIAVPALGLTLPLMRGSGGFFATTTDVPTQMRTNLTNLLLTRLGERPMQPDFGCNLSSVLFNQQTDDGLAEIQAAIEQAVQSWMPFIQVSAVQVNRNQDMEQVSISIAFKLLTAQNITDSITLSF